MIKRLMLLTMVGAAVLTFTAVAPTQAVPHGAACALSGTAVFTPGLTVTPNKSATYTFSGSLSPCEGGTLKAAPPSTKPLTAKISASGRAVSPGIACEAGASSGTASGTWNTGTLSKAAFKTYSAGALTLVQGKVTSSSNPDIKAGDQAAGVLAFSTTTPQACAQGGLKTATFKGATGTGWVI